MVALRAADLLPEEQPASVARSQLFKGVGVAAAALLIPTAVANGELEGGGRAAAVGIAVTASVVGIASFISHKNHREIPANVSANAGRRAQRAATNAAIRSRNQERLAQVKLIVAPAAGIGP